MTTPKMTGMTPTALNGGSLGFSPSLLGQSPAAMLKHRSPIPSGSFSSPGTISALVLGGVDMAMNVTSMPHAPPDENKKRDLSEILKLLETRPGRISEAAVERLARGMGLEFFKEVSPNGIITVSLAAKIFLLDIDFQGSKAVRVALSFEKTPGQSMALAPKAAEIFQRNLTPGSKIPSRAPLLTPSLSEFADNLQRLANTDRLSTTSLNCFTAITGIYESLRKVFEYEKQAAMGDELAALCIGSGRPQMHVRRKVGLTVDYWRARVSPYDGDEKTWRVIVEVQEAPPDFGGLPSTTPVRASNHWVSDDVKKQRDDGLFGDEDDYITDWLEPPLEELMDATGDLAQSRPPAARFFARLDPPVLVPLLDELDPTANYSGAVKMEQLVPLLFPDLPPSHEAARLLSVPVGPADDVQHMYKLHSSLKPVYSRCVSEIPFSHPKELLPMFRTLRQHAMVTTLLSSCFGGAWKDAMGKSRYHKSDLDSFLDSAPGSGASLTVDISLAPEHSFGIGVVFPIPSGLVNMMVIVDKNAELRVNLVDVGGAVTSLIDAEAVKKALKASMDLGVVVEWIKRKQQ